MQSRFKKEKKEKKTFQTFPKVPLEDVDALRPHIIGSPPPKKKK